MVKAYDDWAIRGFKYITYAGYEVDSLPKTDG